MLHARQQSVQSPHVDSAIPKGQKKKTGICTEKHMRETSFSVLKMHVLHERERERQRVKDGERGVDFGQLPILNATDTN